MSISPILSQQVKLPPFNGAAQHVPRPLPLLLQLIEQEGRQKPADMMAALAGLKRYQEAERAAPARKLAIHAQSGPVRLLRSRKWEAGRDTVLMIPSIINGPEILDLAEGFSLLDAIAERHNALLLDWGEVTADRWGEALETLIMSHLLPLVAGLERAPHVLGYCLGGIFAIALAHLHAVRSLALVATPWDFSRYPAHHRNYVAQLWQSQSPACRDLGLLPFELLQCGFWFLEPERVVAKYAQVAQMDENRFRQFVRVEDWANLGQPLMLAAARDLVDGLIQDNATATGQWRIAGSLIDGVPDNVPCFSVRSTNDRIVPKDVSASFGSVSSVRSGHIGMMVGSARKAQLWNPLDKWFASNQSTQ